MNESSRSPAVLVLTGLLREAKLAAGPDVVTVAGGGDQRALESRLGAFDLSGIAAVLSFGLAGALEPTLEVGAVICPDTVLGTDGDSLPVDPSTCVRQRALLSAAGLAVAGGGLLGVDEPVLGVGAKAALRAASAAVAVDMESHVAARFAAARGLPFTALRVISDGAGRNLPPVAGRAMRPDGSVDVLGVLRGLARDPGQLPGLLATARDAAVAVRVLGRVRRLLGPGLGFDL